MDKWTRRGQTLRNHSKSVAFNGKPVSNWRLPYADLMSGGGALFVGHCRKNCRKGGVCCKKISPKDENILIFGGNSPVDPLRFPQNLKIMV